MNANVDKKAGLDLGALMDESLDNVEEAPDFTTPPNGDYRFKVKECKIEKYIPKPKDGKVFPEAQRIKLLYAIVQTYALASANEQPVPDGSLVSESFMGTEEGVGYFKLKVKKILNADITGVKLRDIIATLAGAEFDARVSIRTTPNPAGGSYENAQINPIVRKEAS